MTNETLGVAPIVRRRTCTFPSRMASYWDLGAWGGGFMRCRDAPGAVVIDHAKGTMFDMRTGRVYLDSRFATVKGE